MQMEILNLARRKESSYSEVTTAYTRSSAVGDGFTQVLLYNKVQRKKGGGSEIEVRGGRLDRVKNDNLSVAAG